MSRTARGRFITLEGGEGTGKSTLLDELRGSAEAADAVFTREPGGSEGAEAIRELLVSGAASRWDAVGEVLLVSAARRDHVQRRIEPALAAGRNVICDRYVDSTRAYQGLRGAARGLIERLHREVVGLDPEITLILDAPVETTLERARIRGGADRFERLGLDFHRELRESFLDIAADEPERCIVLDATLAPTDLLATAREALGWARE